MIMLVGLIYPAPRILLNPRHIKHILIINFAIIHISNIDYNPSHPYTTNIITYITYYKFQI